MEIFRFVFGIICVSEGVFGKIFTPCELAQNIYKIVTAKYGIVDFMNGNQEGLSVMVCIGGYHKFNTSSIITTDDGLRRQGIFGLISKKCNQSKGGAIQPNQPTQSNQSAIEPNFTDDDIQDDVEFLVENVLYTRQDRKLVRNNLVYNFYEDLCDRFTAGIEIFCRINDYVVGNVPISIPQEDKLLYGKCYQPAGGQGALRRCQIDSLFNFEDGPVIFPPPMRTIGIRSPTSLNVTGAGNSTDVY